VLVVEGSKNGKFNTTEGHVIKNRIFFCKSNLNRIEKKYVAAQQVRISFFVGMGRTSDRCRLSRN
jgi:hypothetical protein